MEEFRYYHPIEVRYGDLDPQAHVNNAKFLTYLEQARINYMRYLGLWESDSFLDIGIILADVHIAYRAPITFRQPVRVGVCFDRLGNKSLKMKYRIENSQTGQEYATAETVQVAYDYRTQSTIPIPDLWREKISDFDNLPDK